jgi:hypothetical protein
MDSSLAAEPHPNDGRKIKTLPPRHRVLRVVVVCFRALSTTTQARSTVKIAPGPLVVRRSQANQTDMNLEMMLNLTDRASRCQSLLIQPGPLRQTVVKKLDEYKTHLLDELKAESQAFRDLVKLSVTEAEALAWSTPYPHLFLPALAEEKIACVQLWTLRQSRIAPASPVRRQAEKLSNSP